MSIFAISIPNSPICSFILAYSLTLVSVLIISFNNSFSPVSNFIILAFSSASFSVLNSTPMSCVQVGHLLLFSKNSKFFLWFNKFVSILASNLASVLTSSLALSSSTNSILFCTIFSFNIVNLSL